MSTCISQHGEYSDHVPDDAYTCARCGVLDEDALIAELRALRAELARRDAALADLTRQRDEARVAAKGVHLACPAPALEAELAQARKGLAAANPYWRLRSDRYEAQVERQAPVIEAARAYVAAMLELTHGRRDDGIFSDGFKALIAAVDALGPVDPEATDG